MILYNSLIQKKERFVPLEDKKVKLYVCGITPYDITHLGHAFTYVAFDVLYRFLKYSGYGVTYIQNVTDVDDDLLKRAKRDGKNWKELGNFWTRRFLTDLKALNVLPPTHYVKATGSIFAIIEIVKGLIDKGFAYVKNGNVYFQVKKFDRFGNLSQFTEKQMVHFLKERGGDPNDQKKIHPLDFILWQKSKEDEPWWNSPWGKGRPGWHIECSAMNYQFLGPQIDIHGGGRDLIYPHHESEIAQSESFTGEVPFSKYWMHIAMLMYQGEKMSKSLGNLVLVADLLKKYSGDVIRWVLLSHHYRAPWEFHMEELDEAKRKILLIKKNKFVPSSEHNKELLSYLGDDLNTPKILGLIFARPKEYGSFTKVLGFSF
jgi:L-cysteine:1D-myo-inositol 2-amino-2-deoxy-alpha-D-glucopyranoside ligase